MPVYDCTNKFERLNIFVSEFARRAGPQVLNEATTLSDLNTLTGGLRGHHTIPYHTVGLR
jgi:hypothetical protein